jgi:hypothetical protein
MDRTVQMLDRTISVLDQLIATLEHRRFRQGYLFGAIVSMTVTVAAVKLGLLPF